jgi:hypothetical protein
MIGFPMYWKCFEILEKSIRTGKSTTEEISPGGAWAYLASNPDKSKIFDDAMIGKSQGQIAGVIATYDFKPFKTIADIGGGRGHLLEAVLNKAPHATGVLFDQPHVVGDVKPSARMELQGGDFFKDVLPVCDAYMIMQVIHDWSDNHALEILKAIRRSAPPHARLLLIEAIVPDDAEPSWIKMLDIGMLTLLDGKERTRPEFEKLLGAAGFKLERVIEIGLGTSILEASCG